MNALCSMNIVTGRNQQCLSHGHNLSCRCSRHTTVTTDSTRELKSRWTVLYHFKPCLPGLGLSRQQDRCSVGKDVASYARDIEEPMNGLELLIKALESLGCL